MIYKLNDLEITETSMVLFYFTVHNLPQETTFNLVFCVVNGGGISNSCLSFVNDLFFILCCYDCF